MSTRRRFYITTAIPYVNGDPHLGFALELVQADVLARHRRLRGEEVRFLSGTDDSALKNVDAALAAGVPVAEFVEEKAQRFADLAAPLQLGNDDFIRTRPTGDIAPASSAFGLRAPDPVIFTSATTKASTALAAKRSSHPESCRTAPVRSTRRSQS